VTSATRPRIKAAKRNKGVNGLVIKARVRFPAMPEEVSVSGVVSGLLMA
jgi:hypothetical protein